MITRNKQYLIGYGTSDTTNEGMGASTLAWELVHSSNLSGDTPNTYDT